MVVTRSQDGREPAEEQPRTRQATLRRTFAEPPQSPSTGPLREEGQEMEPPRGEGQEREPSRTEVPRTVTIRAPSVRSTSSATARIRAAEIAAAERLAAIRKKELELEADLIKKRLAAEIEDIQEEERVASETGDHAHERVEGWLREQPIATATTTTRVEDTGAPRGEPPDEGRYSRSPTRTPARERQRSSGRAIEQLAEAIRDMAYRPGRQELPIFSGAATEWLPFRAAIRDSGILTKGTPADNLAKLRSSLRGEAREVVAALLYTAADPVLIVRTLDQYYGRPEHIIDRALEEIRHLPKPGAAAMDLNKFAIKLQNIVSIIQNIDNSGYLMNPMLARDVIEKLNPHTRTRWCDFAADRKRPGESDIVALSRFLMEEADKAMMYSYTPMASGSGTQASTSKPPVKKSARIYNASETTARNDNNGQVSDNKRQIKCVCCGGDHLVPDCDRFKDKSESDRWELIKKCRLCFLCLVSTHRRQNCKARACDRCARPHHHLLHADRRTTPVQETVVTATATTDRQVLLKMCPVTLRGPLGEVRTYALLDEGATVSLIDADLAKSLTKGGTPRPITIKGVNATTKEEASREVQLNIKGRFENEEHELVLRTMKNFELTPQTVPGRVSKYPHLKDIEGLTYGKAKPQVLIGADHWDLLVATDVRRGAKHEPAATRTPLGWVVHGILPFRMIKKNGGTVLHIVDNLEKIVAWNFEMEALGVGVRKATKPAEEKAESTFRETVRRTPDERIEVGLTWKEGNVTLPPSYKEALKRLVNLERRMDRNPTFKSSYELQIRRLIEKGYVEPVTRLEEEKRWFLPHFATTNLNKPEKIRLVFDAAAQSDGRCLNDYLLEGPNRLKDLPGILYRFREEEVAVSADIAEMFLQVQVRKEDRPALTFLWRGEDRTNPPQRYQFKRLIFGANCSPFLAHSARDYNAESFRKEHPRAYRAITHCHYMDDYIDSFKTEEEASEVAEEVNSVHERAGFNLRCWSSNATGVLKTLPVEKLAREEDVILTNRPEAPDKTLGMIWHPATDQIGFNTRMARVPAEIKDGMKIPTKRQTLSLVMSLYDPLGLISPHILTGRIILKDVWKSEIDWDQELDAPEAQEIKIWLGRLDQLAEIKIQRKYDKLRETEEGELHVFCDASEQGYAAVAYARFPKKNGGAGVSLLASKAKVSPKKTQTIPRLELQAAVIATRLAVSLKREHRLRFSRTFYWTDSSTVLHWIKNGAKLERQYVQVRLGEIQEDSEPQEWRWVPTEMNVADEATRKKLDGEVITTTWLNGPEFLKDPEASWPELEERAVHTAQEEPHDTLIDMSRFSSYEKLVRTLAYVLLFIQRVKTKSKRELDVQHLEGAEKILTIMAQQESFPKEVKELRTGKPIPKESRLFALDPAMASSG
ncbi:uncharacterized protein LOC135083645 [Ostrinia nubilalis]|uniref:uncharacterized protein LOC135083645 n=1 Tax=Ostrinia nubilalis TaxID=29057 RepID=UPI0030824969